MAGDRFRMGTNEVPVLDDNWRNVEESLSALEGESSGAVMQSGRTGGQAITAATDADQWLGIGVDPPLAKLHVDGSQNASNELRVSNANAGASANVRLRLAAEVAALIAGADSSASAAALAGITLASWSFLASTAGNGLVLGTSNNTPLVLMTNNLERARIEADGTVRLYQTQRSTATFTKTADTTLAGVTGLSFTVAAGRAYAFRAVLHVDGPAAGGVKIGVGGTATATNMAAALSVETNTPATLLLSRSTTFGAGVGVTATVTSGRAVIEGAILVNAGGTLVPLFAQNAASGASTVAINSTWQVWPI